MKHPRHIILAGILALSGGFAVAGSSSQWATVVQVNVANDILIKTDEAFLHDPDTCNSGLPPDFYVIPASSNSQTKILATALTAKADPSIQVRFWISGCVGTRPSRLLKKSV